MGFRRLSPVCLAFAGALVGGTAHADTATDYPAPCDEASVSKVDHDRAHSVFLSGKGFLDESDYDKAISYFKDAYAIDCSVHALLPIIATAYERKGDRAEAIRALGEYLDRAPHAADREIIEHRIRNLKEQAAKEQAPPPVTPATPAPPPVAAPPPTTQLPASAPTSTTTPPATTSPLPPPVESTSGKGPGPGPWVVVGVGTGVFVTGGLLVLAGVGKINAAVKECPGHSCPKGDPAVAADATTKQNAGYGLVNAGAVVGGVGLAGVIGGVIWMAASHGSHTASESVPTAFLSPSVAPGYGGMVFGGSF